MQKLVIEGGKPLHGSVVASGSKNAALPLLIATLLAPGDHRLARVPDLADTSAALSLLGRLGCPSLTDGDTVRLDTTRIAWCDAPKRITSRFRASVLLLGPLLARCGEARVPQPGGCAIGERPIDEHLRGLEALGCRFEEVDGFVHGAVARLVGADIHLRVPTVTGTENLVMAASLAEGTTRITNAAREPEVVELCEFLNAMGARIRGAGSPTIEIEGVRALCPLAEPWRVAPDRIETATWLCAAAITGGDVTVNGAMPHHLDAVLDALRAAGCHVEVGADWVRCARQGPLRALDLATAPYPGFPTDMQPVFAAMGTLARGRTTIEENLFESRFKHAAELSRMGARVRASGRTLQIDGVERLHGATVSASDLRAGAALLLAGLAAEGTTHLLHPEQLDRGYEDCVEKATALGGRIRREAVELDNAALNREPEEPGVAGLGRG